MGCALSVPKTARQNRRRLKRNEMEIAVFVPGLRIPKSVDFSSPLSCSLPKSLIERLSVLRTRIIVMAAHEAPTTKSNRRFRAATQHGGSTFSDLLQALEEYLPVLLGLVEDAQLKDKVSFVWGNQEDIEEESAMANAWYEVLSTLHMMAMLCLSEANSLFLKLNDHEYHSATSEEARCKSVYIFLKAAGYLDCAVQTVLPHITNQSRKDLPADLSKEVLQALCFQALGQAVYIQLVMAINCPKATLAVKRRLACEMVKYWYQAQESMSQVMPTEGWDKKHILFVTWKWTEAKAVAYYYHGLILDEDNTGKSHTMAEGAFLAADTFLKECNRVREAFHAAPPLSRNPPLWYCLTSLLEEIPREVDGKLNTSTDHCSKKNIIDAAPPLPDFVLSLKPEDYQLPPADPEWTVRHNNQLRQHREPMLTSYRHHVETQKQEVFAV